MNIIKFKDIRLDESMLSKCNCSHKLSEEQIRLFNRKFKGKYAYAINWEIAVPLEYMTQEEYIQVSTGVLKVSDSICLDIKYLPSILIDVEETNAINNVDKFETLNKYTTDSEVTLDEIKRFRPWLAHTLLLTGEFDCDTTHMLEYYSYDDDSTMEGSGMYDGVIKQLSSFGNTKMIFNTPTYTSSCGCHGDTKGNLNSFNNISSLNTHKCECSSNGLSMLNNCGKSFDIVSIYKMNLYVKMVDTFRNIDFWLPFKDTVVIDMKKYVDNIIKVQLPLTTARPASNYIDCGCLSTKNAEQEINIGILKNLSEALGYIISGEIKSHKNFINDALLKWASVLYEKMYWYNQVNIQQNHSCGKSSVFMYVHDGDVYIKGIDGNNNRCDYKILDGKDVAEPLSDTDIVTGKFFKDYIDNVIAIENEKDEDRHEFQPIGRNANIINIIENLE